MKRTCFLLVCYCCALTLRSQHIEYSPLYSSNTFDAQHIDVSKPVGSTAGTAGVSSLGSATYSIPIAVPPGTNGVVPSISLEYNSQSGPGIGGMGWALSGMSAITRVPQNVYFDGMVNPVQLGAGDRFALDGQRMLAKTGTYGDNSSTYGTEIENFAVITIRDMQGSCPKWFEVLDKDGVRMQYGNTADSRFMSEDNTSVIFWMLNRIIHPDGNYIDYQYSTSDREPRITRILYTGNADAGLLPYNEISFEYKIRQSGEFSDIRTIYIGGAAVTSRFLLDKIIVKSEEHMVRSYQLTYGNDGINSYLKSVRESGSDGTALNPTIFKYGDKPEARAVFSTTIPSGNNVSSFSADFNRDGLSDIVTSSFTTQNGIRYMSEFKVWVKQSAFSADYSLLAIQSLPATTTIYDWSKVRHQNGLLSADFDGDGLADVLTMKIAPGNPYPGGAVHELNLYRKLEGALPHFQVQSLPLPDNFRGIEGANHWILTGDFNGDGKKDYLLFLAGVATSDRAFIGLSDATGWTCSQLMTPDLLSIPVYSWQEADKAEILDFDGDGKEELMLIKNNTCEIYSFSGNTFTRVYHSNSFNKDYRFHLGDFNGDGKTDILQADISNLNLTALISTGRDFNSHPVTLQTPWHPQVQPGGMDIVVVGDFNGDGKSDISYEWQKVRYTEDHAGAYTHLYSGNDIYYSTGNGFVYRQITYHSSVDGPYQPDMTPVSPLSLSEPPTYIPDSPVDLNGDGRTDILYGAGSLIATRLYNRDGNENRLEKVKTGTGHQSEWIYAKTAGDNYFYNNGASSFTFPLTILNPAWTLARKLTVSGGSAGAITSSYGYEGAVFHRQGKGFLGFGKIMIDDLAMETRTTSSSQFNTACYTAVPWQTVLSVISGGQISETTLTNELVNVGPRRFRVKLNSVTRNDNIRGITTTTDNTYDSHGNITASVVTIPGVHTTLTNTIYQAFPGSIPNKPVSVTVTNTRSGQPSHSVTTSYGYNNKGQLTAQTDFSGLEKQVTTVYGYSNLGNVVSTSVSASGVATRTTTAVFDNKGRYAESTTNEMGYGASAAYDHKWGVLLSVTNRQGIATGYEYDSFGRLRKTHFPEGYSQGVSYHWDISGSQRWYVQVSAPGHPTIKTWYDVPGREIRNETELFDGAWSVQTQTYDSRGNVHTVTEPHKNGEEYITTTNNYDAYNRLTGINRGVLGNTTIAYAGAGGNMTITTSSPSGTLSTTTDAGGMLISATDNGGVLTYYYASHGGLKEVKSGSAGGSGIVLTTSEYDTYGRQTRLTDPDAGVTEYSYDALGQLIWQKNAKGQETHVQYNLAGQIVSRSGPEGVTSYSYGTSNIGTEKRGFVKTVSGFAGNSSSSQYNSLGQLTVFTENNDGLHATNYTYNSAGKISSMSYPSGLLVTYEYNSRGYLSKIRDGILDLYTTIGMNGRGQVTSYSKGNGKESFIEYIHDFPTRYHTSDVQDLRLNWDYQKGNLSSRQDVRKGMAESFTYDDLNRLTAANVSGGALFSTAYTQNGNISSKSGAGSYSYDSNRIHAVTSVTNSGTPSAVPLLTQDVSYTAFMQPYVITEGNYNLTYTYGPGYNRIRSELKQDGSTINTRYYFEAGYEKDITGGIARYIQYISGPVGLVAIIESTGGSHHKHYTYTDHLGSILVATNGSGSVESEQHFDAWGRRRDVNNWELLPPAAMTGLPVWLYRGYTGHEHLDRFGLINMNGRMYDPVTGRMLSADNYVPDPLFSQDYNRYTYARNNPLIYTDPDGEFWHIVIGAALGGGINLGVQAIQGNVNSFGDGLKAFGKGAIIGGMSAIGCASCSVGTLALGSAIAVGNSYLPSYSTPLGKSGFSLSTGVSVGFGSTGLFAGANFGLNYSSESFSYGFSYGISYNFTDNITGKSGWSQSYGGGVIVGGNDFRLGIFTNHFGGRGLGQQTGTFYLESNGWSAAYENDWMFGVPISDGGDRFRTTGVRIAKGDFSVGLNLFTGDPGLKFDNRTRKGENKETGFWGTYEEITKQYRLGAIYGGYRGYRAGWNSEGIRNVFQNNFAHGKGYTHPLFEVLKIKGASYINYYKTGNRYTTWY